MSRWEVVLPPRHQESLQLWPLAHREGRGNNIVSDCEELATFDLWPQWQDWPTHPSDEATGNSSREGAWELTCFHSFQTGGSQCREERMVWRHWLNAVYTKERPSGHTWRCGPQPRSSFRGESLKKGKGPANLKPDGLQQVVCLWTWK